ncbi:MULTISPECIES: S8 family serine peptidase [Halorussus]|uniref:S8 family serine peptidase n=1 Tax=Halorussus TaxID=1070314 RepID=UPI00209D0E2B|nr:S8 family serine peptidase [Halorussus vallis]USZ77109.1 S8 family serine peptidase [Halorussus vallis]
MKAPSRGVGRRAAALALALLLVVGGVAPSFVSAHAVDASPASNAGEAPGVQMSDVRASSVRASSLDDSPTDPAIAGSVSESPGKLTAGSSGEPNDPAAFPDADAVTLDANRTVVVNETAGLATVVADPPAAPPNATRVTLVTGQTVTVVREGDRTLYRVSGDDRMRVVATADAAYVYPVGVDFERFDSQLFDVGFLVDQGLADADTDSIPVIVGTNERSRLAGSDGRVESPLESVAGVERRSRLESIDAEAGVVAKDRARRAYEALAADPNVGLVTLDVKYRLQLEDADESASASLAREVHGVSGEGVTVAVLDSGIDDSHPAIDRVIAERDFTYEGRTDDPNGHGTHVAGIVASDDDKYTGMAPNASLMDVRVLNSEGWGYTSWIVDGIEYATRNGADIVSMSLGGPVTSRRSNDRYAQAVNSAVAQGTLVVSSAGNDGPGYRTVTTPGIHSNALTVGASYDDGSVTYFSARGPTKFGHFLKPDLIAPGWGVVSAKAGTDGFTRKSGTSMSAPVVSGVAALVLEKHPDWSPERVKSVLTTTADPLPVPDVYTQGAGGVDAADAVGTDLVVSPGTVDFGTVRSDRPESATVTLTNVGDETRRLNASAKATDIEDGNTESMPVNRSTVTLAPGETAHLELGLDESVPPGVYSGRLSLGRNYSVVFGFLRLHEVTVRKVGAANTSVDGDPVQLFADRKGRWKLTGEEGYARLDGAAGAASANDSSVTYRMVEGGTYHVLSHGRDEATGRPVVFQRTLTVDGDELVVLNESDTVGRALDASALEANAGAVATRSVKVRYSKRTAGGARYGGTVATASPDDATVMFDRNADLNATVGRVLVAGGAAGEEAGGESGSGAAVASTDADAFDAPAVYQLIHRIDGVGEGGTTSVDPAALAATNATYHRAAPGESYDVALTATGEGPAGGQFSHAVVDGIGDRRRQTVYLGRGVATHDVAATAESDASATWRLRSPTSHSPAPGETREVGFNRHPFVGDLRWRVADGTLSYRAVGQRDRAGHQFVDGSDDRIRIERDGTRVLDRTLPATPAWRDAGVAVSSGDRIAVTVDGRNGAPPLSTRTVTTRRATYDPGADSTPPAIRDVAVLAGSTNNTAGGELRVRFAVAGGDAGARALVAADAADVPFPFDGAGEWREGTVERLEAASTDRVTVYRATFDVAEHIGERRETVDLALRATDERGNAVEVTTFDAFRVDARDPTIAVTAAGATETPTGVPSGPIYTNGTLTVNATVDGTPGDTRSVGMTLSADFANFRAGAPATSDDGHNWTATWDLGDLPDDGSYTVGVAGTDRHRNVGRTEAATVVLDRESPALGATITRVDDATGRVEVSASERLASDPAVAVELPNGTTTDLDVNRSGNVWTDTFALGDAGSTYRATATGTDLTGNVGRANSTADVESVNTENGTATVVLEHSGQFVQFRTARDVDSTATVTGSSNALAPLSRNLAGVNFLNGELGGELSRNLTDATIGIPVENLPEGVREGDVEIRYYDEAAREWERLDTSVETRNVTGEAKRYWVANVTHFSTYGAVVADDTPPTLDRKSPDGVTYDAGTSRATVEFDYGDDISGVDAGAVDVYFDGRRVTDDSATSVTGEYVRYDATGLAEGDHQATVRVVDRAGNARNYTTSFRVGAANSQVSPGRNGGGGDGDGGGGDSGGSGGNGGGGGGSNVPPPSVQVELLDPTASSATAKITNARADSPGRVSFAGGLSAGDATVRGLTVVPASSGPEARFLVDVRATESPPAGATAFDGVSETLGYVTATPTYITDAELEAVSVAFAVDAERARSPKNVGLYRYRDGTWKRLPTTFRHERGGSYLFRASASGTGTFAVGLAAPSVAVSEASLGASSVAVGESTTVTATVENRGDGTGTVPVELEVDGAVVAAKDVTLAAGESTTVTFERTFETDGRYEISVGGTAAGVVSVTSVAAAETSETTESDDETRNSGGSGATPGFGVAATLAALLAGLLVVRRRSS